MPNGKVVAITAASSGLGEAIALQLAARGAKLVLGGRNVEGLRRIAGDIERAGGEVAFAAIDPVDRAQVATLVTRALDTFGRLDVCIANAGALPAGTMDDFTDAEWERAADAAVKGVLWAIAAASPAFREQAFGHFIAIAPTAGWTIGSGMAAHAGIEAAVAAMCDALRQDMRGRSRATTLFARPTAKTFAGRVGDEALRSPAKGGAFVALPPDAIVSAIVSAIGRAEVADVRDIARRASAGAPRLDSAFASTARQNGMRYALGRR